MKENQTKLLKKAPQRKWMKFRHRVVRNIANAILYPIAKARYGLQVDKFPRKDKRPFLILYNHQTDFDQFFIGMCFDGPVYYVASEDIFSNGFTSSLIRYLVAPIPIRKSTSDARAVMNCMRVAKEGGTIAIAPEGNRTYSGRTETIKPAIASLAKSLRLPIALVRIEGGYGVQPRWSNGTRKGKIHVYVSEVIEPSEYKDLSKEELYDRIVKGLTVDESLFTENYQGKRLAEFLDRVFYVCPDCGLSEFYSENDRLSCKKCGKTVRYLPNKTFFDETGKFPFRNTVEWYRYQEKFIHDLDLSTLEETPVYQEEVRLSQVQLYKKKILLDKKALFTLYRDRYEFTVKGKTTSVPFDDVAAVTVLGRNKINVYFGEKGSILWQAKGGKHFNPIKYMHFYFHDQNVKKGETEHEFLGL